MIKFSGFKINRESQTLQDLRCVSQVEDIPGSSIQLQQPVTHMRGKSVICHL